MALTEAQEKWLAQHAEFGPVGPPRKVTFAEWGNLYPDGTYERMDNAPGKPIKLPCLGVARIAPAPQSPPSGDEGEVDHDIEVLRNFEGIERQHALMCNEPFKAAYTERADALARAVSRLDRATTAERERDTAQEEYLRAWNERDAQRRRAEAAEEILKFVWRWAWYKDGNGTSAEERLDTIKHHPGIAALNKEQP